MKHFKIQILLTFVLAILTFALYGQRSLDHTVLSAFGHEASSATYESIVHTGGELMTQTFMGNSGSKVLTQGFHQVFAPVTKMDVSEEKFLLYPNPAKDVVLISFKSEESQRLKTDLYDIAGKLVLSEFMESDYDNRLNISTLNQGIYLLRFSNEDGKIIHTQKLQKIE